MEKKNIKNIIIAAGGTGGHIYPGISVAEIIEKACSGVNIKFISGCKKIESEIYGSEGRTAFELNVLPTGKSIKDKINALFNFYKASKVASGYIKDFKPDVILGMGGYVSAPVLSAASKMKIPFYIHEQNSIPGKVNKFYSKKAVKCFCTFKKSLEYFDKDKVKLTGLPLRKRFLNLPDKSDACRLFRLDERKPKIFIQGGSQGAKFLNIKILEALISFDKEYGKDVPVQILWSIDKQNFTEMMEIINRKTFNNIKIDIRPFILEIESALKSADLVISRAGAGSIAEIVAVGVPSILIPLPTAADDHQRYNAAEIKDEGAAEILEENQIDKPTFTNLLKSLLSDSSKLSLMIEKTKNISKGDAAEEIADVILN